MFGTSTIPYPLLLNPSPVSDACWVAASSWRPKPSPLVYDKGPDSRLAPSTLDP